MNNNRITKVPGGDAMLIGGAVLVFALLVFNAYQYRLGSIARLVLYAGMLWGGANFVRGAFRWKYTDRRTFAAGTNHENLFIDVPLNGVDVSMLHKIEDAVIDRVRQSNLIKHDGHSIDSPNAMGTIYLCGKQADAMFAQVYSALAKFAMPNGLHLFPLQGQPVDAAINGKRVLVDLPSVELSR